MRKRIFFLYFIVAINMFFFTACSKTPKESFSALKPLQGIWKSTGNIVVFEQWKMASDTVIEGKRFSVNRKDTLFINAFSIVKEKGIIRFEIKENKKKSNSFNFVKAGRKEVLFENNKMSYPNRIILGFPKDSLYSYRQENSRGNKAVVFQMKRD